MMSVKTFNRAANMYKVLYAVKEVNRAITEEKYSLSTFTLISKLYLNSISYLTFLCSSMMLQFLSKICLKVNLF